MEKKRQTIDKKKLMKAVFWAAVLVLVLFFGRRLLPEEKMGGGNGSDVSGNEGENGDNESGVSGNGNASGYKENDGEEIQRGTTLVLKGGERYVETSASGSWGLGFGQDGSERQPTGSLSKEELAKYDAWFLGDDAEKTLYLTFDCGYENGNTEKILDALQKHNAKAAFFVVGHFLDSAPELVKRMKEEGHIVGNHTWSHPDMDTISGEDKFREELDLVSGKYQEITGQELSCFYRPPQGKYHLSNLAMAQKLGYKTIFWSLAYVDWNVDAQPSKEEAFAKLLGRVHPGAVVLLHSTSATNGEILDELLTKWEEMGYRFGTLEELTA